MAFPVHQTRNFFNLSPFQLGLLQACLISLRAPSSHISVCHHQALGYTGASLMPAIKQIAARHLQLFNVFMQMLQ
jgi:hypothetical protein